MKNKRFYVLFVIMLILLNIITLAICIVSLHTMAARLYIIGLFLLLDAIEITGFILHVRNINDSMDILDKSMDITNSIEDNKNESDITITEFETMFIK